MDQKPRPPRPPMKNGPSFPVIRPIVDGFGFMWRHKKLVLGLTLAPLLISLLAQYTVIAYFSESPFRAAIVQLPAEFVLGLSAMIVASFVLREQKHIGTARSLQEENIKMITTPKDRFMPMAEMMQWGYQLRHAILAYGFINYLMSGFIAAMLTLYDRADIQIETVDSTNPEAVQASVENAENHSLEIFLILFLFVGLIWFLRYLWLPVLVLMKAPIKESYRKIGGMEGSVLIGVMYMMIIIVTLLFMSIILSLVLPAMGVTSAENMSNAATTVRDALSTFAMIIAQFAFTAASVYAIKAMNEKKTS